MQTQLEERMALMSRLGANLAIVLCAIFLAPLLYTLYESEFYAMWTHWIIDKFNIRTASMMLLSLIYVMYYSMRFCKEGMPEFAYKVASPISRFIRGFIVGTGKFIFFAAIAIILTYVGITPIACQLIYLAFTIVFMIIFLIVGIFK
jgi:hypothetical protein